MRSTSNGSATDRGARVRLALLAALAAGASCSRPETVIAFRVLGENLVPAWCDQPQHRNEPRCPQGAYRVDGVLVRVCRGDCASPESNDCRGNELFCRTYLDGPPSSPQNLLPGDVTVSPSDPGAGARVGVVVVATVRVPGAAGAPPTAEYIRRRFVVPTVEGTTQLVEVWLSSPCIGAVCPPETTCGRRSCEPVQNPPTRPYTPLPPPGPVDGGDLDVSFDVVRRDAAPDVGPDAPPDVPDVPDVMDVPDVTDVRDVADVMDAPDAMDVRDAADAPDVVDAADAPDASDGPSCGACRVGERCCGGRCVNTATAPDHCGTCGVACGAGLSCCDGRCGPAGPCTGACTPPCGRGTECCGGRCVNTSMDVSNCGGCGTACAGGVCCDGRCTTGDAGAC